MRTTSLKLIAIASFILIGITSQAQQLKSITSDILIEGTSNIHDWEVTSTEATGMIETEDNTVKKIAIEIPVKSLESGKGGMNKNIYKAFNESKNPKIKFVSTSVGASKIEGKLTMNGTTKTVSIPVSTVSKSKVAGSYKLNMTDYNMDPPTAMMGTIKTGETVNISFSFKFNK